MKHGKKLLALALALCMAFALAVPAFAADGDLTVGGTDENSEFVPAPPAADKTDTSPASMANHVFDIFQIFSGEEKTETTGTGDDAQTVTLLTAIQWGSGFNVPQGTAAQTAENIKNFIYALSQEDSFKVEETNPFTSIHTNFDANRLNVSADAVAQVISIWTYDDPRAQKFADIASDYLKTPYKSNVEYGDESTTLNQGYYLVEDKTTVSGDDATEGVSPENKNNVVNRYVLTMNETGKFEPKVKADVPSLKKDVLEVNDSDPTNPEWKKVADYDIGDTVWFTLTGTLPADFDKYEKYTYQFTDIMGTGLAPLANTVKVYLTKRGEQATDADLLVAGTHYTSAVDGQKLTINMTDLKDQTVWSDKNLTANSVFQVVYGAELTAEIETFKVNNEAYLTFSNDPNNTGDGTSETPKDKVTVFTFELKINKLDGDKNPLAGAEFALYKNDPNLAKNADGTDNESITYTKEGKEVTYYLYKNFTKSASTGDDPVENSVFTIEGLDAGDYALVETTTPGGYNSIEDMFFTITAKEETVNGVTSITDLKVGSVTDKNGNEMKDANGNPAVTFEPSVTSAEEAEQTTYGGLLSTDIVNLKGVVLPGTGGIGTTIFYVVGGLLIAGAGILLITKKRMKSAE